MNFKFEKFWFLNSTKSCLLDLIVLMIEFKVFFHQRKYRNFFVQFSYLSGIFKGYLNFWEIKEDSELFKNNFLYNTKIIYIKKLKFKEKKYCNTIAIVRTAVLRQLKQ